MRPTRECRMNKMGPRLGCESCREWQEHCYQEHTVMEGASFFRLMAGDFARGISIPEKFVRNPNGQLTKALSLKSPSGETWPVDVARNADDDEVLLESGWGDFARAHELQEDDVVVFTRGSGSGCSFDVLVLDSSGCEKAPCFFAANKVHGRSNGGARRQAERRRVFRGPEPEGLGTPLRLAVASPHGASTSEQKGGEAKPREEQEPEPPSDSSCRVKQEPSSDGEEEQGDGDRLAGSSYYYSRSSGNLTGGERDQILSLVSVQPGNPAFVTVLMKTHVGHKNSMLIIHHGFAAEHLEGRSHEILLLRPNREERWCVRYYHASHTRGFNCRRWVKFVRDNRLRKDHVCVFELIKGARRTTMLVHVLRKVDGRLVLVA